MSESRDSPSSSSSAPTKRLKRMDRDERIAYLEGEIMESRAKLSSISNKIDILSDEHLALMKIPKPDRDVELVAATEKALADKTKDKDRLIADIAKLEAELEKLREQPVAASSLLFSPPTGNFCAVHRYYIVLSVKNLIHI